MSRGERTDVTNDKEFGACEIIQSSAAVGQLVWAGGGGANNLWGHRPHVFFV